MTSSKMKDLPLKITTNKVVLNKQIFKNTQTLNVGFISNLLPLNRRSLKELTMTQHVVPITVFMTLRALIFYK